MPIRNSQKILLRDFSGGVLRHVDADFTPVNLNQNQLLKCQNAFWRGGLQKRLGYSQLFTTQVNGSARMDSIFRVYLDGGNQLLVAAGGEIDLVNEATGVFTNVKAGLSNDALLSFDKYGPNNKVYIANGNDAPMEWDGSTISNYSAAPIGAAEFIVYKERVWTYHGLILRFSDNLEPDTWQAASSITLTANDVRIIKAIVHTQNVAESSVISQLLVFTSNSTWIISGNDFTTFSDITRQEVSGHIGTESPKSVIKTPLGVIFFGRDQGRNDVFLVVGQGTSTQIISLGQNIRQELNKVSSAGLRHVSAVYFDGYYRLTIRNDANSDSKTEWWLRIDGFSTSNISWYGPMIRTVGMMQTIALSGSGDENLIYGAGEDGRLYRLDHTNDDVSSGNVATAIEVDIQTSFQDFGIIFQDKTPVDTFINIQATGGTVTIGLNADVQPEADETEKTLLLGTDGTGFPYTFPVIFATLPPNIKTKNFRNSGLRGVYFAFRIKFSDLGEKMLFMGIGARFKIFETDKPED